MAEQDARQPGLRDWLGDAPFPWPAVAALDDGATLVACFAVQAAQTAYTRQDKPYLRLKLSDTHGVIEARVWDDAERLEAVARPGTFVGVRGRVESYQGNRQINVDRLEAVRVEPEELELFMPRSARDFDVMNTELVAFIRSIQDAPLRTLLRSLLGADTDTGRWFRMAPAAKMHHHAYVGGLLEHTLSITTICDFLATHYGELIDRDLLITGALLHDIGKIEEIAVDAGFPYTDAGRLLGHILLGLRMVEDAGRQVKDLSAERLRLVLHLVASHQGRYEWQSPREPRILEALLLHHVDDTDAKMFQAMALVRGVDGGWTAYDRSFGRDFLRHDGNGENHDVPPADPTGRPDPDTLSLFE
jgi:3'-5' exoribonuclease